MKKLSDLGISPWPWKCAANNYGEIIGIENGRGFYVVRFAVDVEPNNASIMAAAPELYEFLHEAAYEYCHNCQSGRGECPKAQGDCFVQKWRAALAKAAGESEVKE